MKKAVEGTTCINLLNGVQISNTPILKPYEVLFIEVKDQNPTTALRDITSLTDIDVQVFPNPTTDNLNIGFNRLIKTGTIQILSTTGKTIHRQHISNQQTVSLSLNNTPKGLYLIEVNTRNQKETFRLVKR